MTATKRRKAILLAVSILTMTVASVILLEAATRAYLAATYSSDILLYGTKYCCGTEKTASFDRRSKKDLLRTKYQTVARHRNEQANYSKYFPNEELTDHVRLIAGLLAEALLDHFCGGAG